MTTDKNTLVLQTLQALVRLGPMDRNEIISLIQAIDLRQISGMETSGYIRIERGFSDVCHITNFGRRFIGVAPEKTRATSRVVVSKPGDLYDGAELRPCSMRAGSMDAFALPSRFMDGLHYRDGSVLQIKDSHVN